MRLTGPKLGLNLRTTGAAHVTLYRTCHPSDLFMPRTSIICAIPFPSRLITMHTPTATAIVNNMMFTRRDRCGHSAGTSQTDRQTGQTDNGPIA